MMRFLLARPWLLVVAAFAFLIYGWFATISLSHRVPTKNLTPQEEAALLEGRKP